MEDDETETGGYAIGRRIYEKQEIDVCTLIYNCCSFRERGLSIHLTNERVYKLTNINYYIKG